MHADWGQVSYIRVVTDTENEVVSVAEQKEHSRIDSDIEDNYIESLTTAARHAIERYIGRQLGAQTLEMALAVWPESRRIEFPRPPLIDVLSITYTKADGADVVWYDSEASPVVDPLAFTIETGAEPGALFLNSSSAWPSDALAAGFPIKIRFKAGITDVPQDLKQALMLMAAHQYENREGAEGMPPNIAWLCARHKVEGF
ncbi:MAG TPA: head-tail connector protein [Candidatus Nanoarchaeia archaeon]|nr:head-tail connector protein [Candidatus Nanoarchaeia archaeon]